MEKEASNKDVITDEPEDTTPSPISQAGTDHLKSKFDSMEQRREAAQKSPYDIASKISPLKFEIVAPPERKSSREDPVADAISGRREKRFTKMMTSFEMSDLKKDEVGEDDKESSEMTKLMEETKGAAYMRAEDEEARKLKMEGLEKKARENAMENAITIKAEAIAQEKTTAATKAVEDIKAAVAKRNEAKRSMNAAEDSARKGWLSPKLSAELVLEQKDEVMKDDTAVRQARENEMGIKKVAKMSVKEKKLHKKKHKEAIAGSHAAAAANDKELAMKFVHSEFERRKKQAYKQKLRDVQLNDKMRSSAETMAKNDAAKENAAKTKESEQKGQSREVREKRDDKEKEQKLIDARNKPKPQNCKVGAWKAWTPCSRPCSGGMASRTRTVLTAKGGSGADCPALTEDKPCNTQPCMTVTFSKTYCDQALKKCTESRELFKGCKRNPPRKFGNGDGIQTGMMSENNKVDKLVNGMSKDDAPEDDENEPDSDDSDSATVETPVKKMSANKKMAHDLVRNANRNNKKMAHDLATNAAQHKEPQPVTHEPGAKQRPEVHHQPAPKEAQPAMRPQQPTIHGHRSLGQAAPKRPTVEYEFHDGGHGDAMVTKAVAAAEHAISSNEGADATTYSFALTPGPGSVIGDMQQSFIQTSAGEDPPAGSQQNGPLEAQQKADQQIRQITDPSGAQKKANASDEADKDSDKVLSDEANAQCAKFKDDVAEYCGQMVDCVTKSLDTQDVDYSKQLTKEVQKASKKTGLDDDDQETKDKVDAQEEEREEANKKADEAIPPSQTELTDEEDEEMKKIQNMKVSGVSHFDDSKFLREMPQPVPAFSRPETAEEMKPATKAWLASGKASKGGQSPSSNVDNEMPPGPEQVKGAGLFPH